MHAGPIPSENIIRLVFMGKTGAGKSTVINACYNFTKQKKWDDYPKLFPIPTDFQPCNVPQFTGRLVESHARKQLDAVTQDPSEYVVQGNANYLVNLVDCPGMADPRGIEQDIKNTDKIAQFLARVGDFNALCIVLKGSTNRETAEEKYFIEQVKTIIPASAYNRIFIVATHTNLPSDNVVAFAKSVDLPTENIFYFDNYAFSKDGYVDVKNIDLNETGDDNIGDPFAEVSVSSEDALKKDIARRLRESYPSTHKEYNRLIKTAQRLGKHTSGEMGEISRIKRKVTDKILAAYQKVESIEKCEVDLENARHELSLASDAYDRAMNRKRDVEEDLKYAEAERKAANALATYEEYDGRDRERSTSGQHTTCWICNWTCHEDCGLENGDSLAGCQSMTDGCCTVCPNHCSYTYHRHQDFVWKTVKKRRPLTENTDKQSRASSNYDNVESDLKAKKSDVDSKEHTKNSKSTLFNEFDKRLRCLKQEKDSLQQEIVELYVKLGNVSISSINFHIGEYYDIKSRNEKSSVVRAKLNRDREFYVEQVELYRKRQQANQNI